MGMNIHQISDEDLGTIDFRQSWLPLGVRLESKDADYNWLPLDRDDYAALALLLARPVTDGQSAASVSYGLGALHDWAVAARDWYDRTGFQPRPERSGAGED